MEGKTYFAHGLIFLVVFVSFTYFIFFSALNRFEVSVLGEAGYNVAEEVKNGLDEIDDAADKMLPEEERYSPAGNYKKLAVFVMAAIFGGLFFLLMVTRQISKEKLKSEKTKKEIDSESLIRLVRYIGRESKEGKKEEDLRNALLGEGWNKSIVDKAFSNFHYVRKRIKGVKV